VASGRVVVVLLACRPAGCSQCNNERLVRPGLSRSGRDALGRPPAVGRPGDNFVKRVLRLYQ
jgi:hypothetical protein